MLFQTAMEGPSDGIYVCIYCHAHHHHGVHVSMQEAVVAVVNSPDLRT